MPSCESAWTPSYSGGVPPGETWHDKPQFAIHPTVDGAEYALELVRHASSPAHRMCLWVMTADSMEERKVVINPWPTAMLTPWHKRRYV